MYPIKLKNHCFVLLLTFSFISFSTDAWCQSLEGFSYNGKQYKVGDTVYGYKNYLKLVVGDKDAPLILGVPHDGVGIGDPEIPETGTTGRDIATLPFAVAIESNFKKVTKKSPWIIINTIGRKRVDPNTYPDDVDKRYNEEAKKTYESYHHLLLSARTYMSNAQRAGKGALFLDIHGHAHSYPVLRPYTTVLGRQLESKFIDQTELGYGLSNFAISQSDSYLDQLADSSSIASIAKANAQTPFSKIIRGAESFGGFLNAEKVVAVPGPELLTLEASAELFGVDNNGVAKRRPYFNGGYCSRKYGSTVLGKTVGFNDNISAIQAETPGITVRNNPAIRQVAGERFARAIIKYLNRWYGYSFNI